MEINVNDTGIPHGVSVLASQLPNPALVIESVLLKFSGSEFTYLTGLVLLATWRKALSAGIDVRLDDSLCIESTQRFLTNTGFREIIETGHETPATQYRIGKIPLRPITNQFAREATVNEIISIFDEYAGQVTNMEPFRVLISELCENVLAHSEFVSPGYVCARVIGTKAEIAIADSGIGIEQSYMSGTNEQIKERIQNGTSALELAIDGLNSSKPKPLPGTLRSYYGFGLLIARRLVEENRGQMYLLSGPETLQIDRYGRRQTQLPKPWLGTFIGLILDLANPLPLERIYEEAVEEYIGPEQVTKTTAQIVAVTVDKLQQEVRVASVSEFEAPKGSIQQIEAASAPVKSLELRHYGTELLTRDAGTAIRADLAGYLAAGYRVRVVLDGVSDMTPSVADEAFAKLADVLGHNSFEGKVEFVGGSSIAQRLIKFVIQTRRGRRG